jgi:hypothetical protein
MERPKTKPLSKRKRVPKLYFHFWPQKTGLTGKYQWQEFPVVITGKYHPGKYSKFELKREILENMIFRCD